MTSPPTLPLPVLRLPFFYGWIIVAVAAAAGLLGSSVNNVAMAVIFKPMTEDLGWSRSLTAGAIAVGTIAGGLLGPFIGRLADRVGPRPLLPSGAAAVGLLLVTLALVQEPWQFYAAYVPARALAATLLFNVVPITAVANWFHAMRPRAFGLVAMSVPLGSSLLAIVYQLVIDSAGWRSAYLIPAGLLFGVLLVPAAILLRRRPEDFGLEPDGGRAVPPQRESGRVRREPPVEENWTLREAVRTPTLWLLIFSEALAVTSIGGIAFHLVAYYTDGGVEPLLAAGALSVFAFGGAGANIFWGFLAERVFARKLYISALLLSASGVIILLQTPSALTAYVFAGLFGLSGRGQDTLVHVLTAHYFGRRSFGAISGLSRSISLAGLGVGPFIAASAYDLTGSYRGVFLVFLGAFMLAACLVLLLRKPVLERSVP